MKPNKNQSIPPEFLPENVQANSPESEQLFTHLLKANEFQKNLEKQGLVFTPSPSGGENGVDLDDDSLYYNTQGSAKAYWEKNGPLPSPTKDIKQLRNDFREFGYCLVEDALSQEQLHTMRTRVVEQAEGERLAGIAHFLNASRDQVWDKDITQFVDCLVNKGDCFRGFIEHDPEFIQAGPLIEQLVHETVGEDFIIHSCLCIIARKGGRPQSLHQDKGFKLNEAPLLTTHLLYLEDVSYLNGSTLVIPRSAKIIYESGYQKPVGNLPPPINLEAKAGTLVLMDGYTLHGTGINQTDHPRHMVVMSCIPPWQRTQELHPISLRPEVLANASEKLLKRLTFMTESIGGIEGHGMEAGLLRGMRQAIDEGNYVRVGELSPNSSKEELTRAYTWRFTTTGQRAAMNQPERRYPQEKLWESKDPLEQAPPKRGNH